MKPPDVGSYNRLFAVTHLLNWRKIQPRNRARTSAGIAFKSSSVRKSIVLNWQSRAGGPQIFAPMERYARSSFGIFGDSSAKWSSEQSKAGKGLVRHRASTRCFRHKSA